ncbi:MAG: hypothetical protein ACRDNE_01695 [Gaiellaceae bacterium]
MGRRAVVAVAAGVAAAVLAGHAEASTPPPLALAGDDGGSFLRCAATKPRTIVETGLSCTIIQPAGGTAWCVARTRARKAGSVTQRCVIRQASTRRKNVAHVVQVIEMKGDASPQDATQIADVRQGNRFRDNRASVTQVTRLSLGRRLDDDDRVSSGIAHPDDVAQSQEAHQSVLVCQGAAGALGPSDPSNCRGGAGMRASNFSKVTQKQWERQTAHASGTVVQEQNTEARPNACSPSDVVDPVVPDEDANACANVDQSAQLSHPGSGRNQARLTQLYVELQSARGAAEATQCQGFPDAPCFVSGSPEVGGLDYSVNQSAPKRSKIVTNQRSFQVQRVDDVTRFLRKQDPRISKGGGSAQVTHPDSRWTGLQRATQLQFEDGELGGDTQSALLEYLGATSGRIRAAQVVNQNGQVETNSCSGSVCAAVLACTTAPPEPEEALLEPSTVVFPDQTCTATADDDDDEDEDDED